MSALPTGQVTFLLTDIVGSAKLWEERPEAMRLALAAHEGLARDIIRRHGGALVKGRGEGDSLFAVFARAGDAVPAAGALQRALLRDAAPDGVRLCLRLALHTGQADRRDGDYYGAAVNRCARLRDLAHGCQVLLSQATAALVRHSLPLGLSLRDLGQYPLRDLAQPEHVWQLLHPGLPEHFPPLHSPPSDAPRHNLPRQHTPFVGREREISQVRAGLSQSPLLTLTGPGGGGKTRLALQAVADLANDFPDGAWLVELASLSDPSRVDETVAEVLQIKEASGRSAQEALCETLRPRRLLLILDNCEHLLDACASLAHALLRACPGVKILATSREALGVGGEVVLPVPPLSLPERDAVPAQLASSDAVQLFLARARAAEPPFTLTALNAPAVAQVCRRLDGLPLAIEMAAARIRVLSVEQIAQHLDARSPLLAGGLPTALPRQQSLHALIDWSYGLLRSDEQTLLRRLSIFSDGWTLEAAERVCGGEDVPAGEILPLLGRLVDKSLASVDAGGGPDRRYRLLGVVRHFGQERLAEAGEAADLRARHRAWLLALAEGEAADQRGGDLGVWLNRLEDEHDNLQAALQGSLAEWDGGEACRRLVGALGRFWFIRGHWAEGREWLERALALGDISSISRARVLRAASVLAWARGDGDAARATAQESLTIAEAWGDRRGVAHALECLGLAARQRGEWGAARALLENSLALSREEHWERDVAHLLGCLGELALFQGDNERSQALLEESLRLSQTLGSRRDQAYALANLGSVALAAGRPEAARSLLEKSLAVFRDLGEPWAIAYGQWSLGNVTAAAGGFGQAQEYYGEALRLLRDLDSRWSIGFALEALGHLAAAQTQWERAVRLVGAAQALRSGLHCPLPPAVSGPHRACLAAAHARLGERAYRDAWSAGQTLSLTAAIEEGLAAPAHPPEAWERTPVPMRG